MIISVVSSVVNAIPINGYCAGHDLGVDDAETACNNAK